jgi:hypothetical protein
MAEIIKRKEDWTRKEISRAEALELFKDQKYKTELIEDLPEDEVISIYWTGDDFVDLCRGPHVENSKELMQAAYRLLTDDGEFSVIVPFDYKKRMEDEAVFVGFFPHRVLGLRTVEKKPAKRYCLSFVKHPVEREHHVITLGDEEYKELTGPFYL